MDGKGSNNQHDMAKYSDGKMGSTDKKNHDDEGSSGSYSANDGEESRACGRKPAASGPGRPTRRLFPRKLWKMIEDAATEGNEHIIRWLPDGRSFRVLMPKLFAEIILPRYVQQSNYRSFQRQLYLYNFKRILDKGPSQDSYEHPLFRKDGRQLVNMIPQKSKRRTPRRPTKKKEQEVECGVSIDHGNADANRVIACSPQATLLGRVQLNSLSSVNYARTAGSVPPVYNSGSPEVIDQIRLPQLNLQARAKEAQDNGSSLGSSSVDRFCASMERSYTSEALTLLNASRIQQASNPEGQSDCQNLPERHKASHSVSLQPNFGSKQGEVSNELGSKSTTALASSGTVNLNSFRSVEFQQQPSSRDGALPEVRLEYQNRYQRNIDAGYPPGFQELDSEPTGTFLPATNIQVSEMQKLFTRRNEGARENDEDDLSMGSDFSHAVTAAVTNAENTNSMLQFPVNMLTLQPVDDSVFEGPYPRIQRQL